MNTKPLCSRLSELSRQIPISQSKFVELVHSSSPKEPFYCFRGQDLRYYMGILTELAPGEGQQWYVTSSRDKLISIEHPQSTRL